jgi:hypothetical protein
MDAVVHEVFLDQAQSVGASDSDGIADGFSEDVGVSVTEGIKDKDGISDMDGDAVLEGALEKDGCLVTEGWSDTDGWTETVGPLDGTKLGTSDGPSEGERDGMSEGEIDGTCEGRIEGDTERVGAGVKHRKEPSKSTHPNSQGLNLSHSVDRGDRCEVSVCRGAHHCWLVLLVGIAFLPLISTQIRSISSKPGRQTQTG